MCTCSLERQNQYFIYLCIYRFMRGDLLRELAHVITAAEKSCDRSSGDTGMLIVWPVQVGSPQNQGSLWCNSQIEAEYLRIVCWYKPWSLNARRWHFLSSQVEIPICLLYLFFLDPNPLNGAYPHWGKIFPT
jgi:hypothetical protein